jgi:Fe-S cluster biogenesis protein NfuA
LGELHGLLFLNMSEKKNFHERLQKIDALLETIDTSADPNIRTAATALMQATMEMHAAALERVMDVIFESGPHGGEIIEQLARDETVESLLLLYGLHPLDLDERVLRALDKVRPYLESHGGNVEILGINDGVVRLRLQGSCNGCSSSAMTLKTAIEESVYESAPDIISLEVEGVVDPRETPALVKLERTCEVRSEKNGSVAAQPGENIAAAF